MSIYTRDSRKEKRFLSLTTHSSPQGYGLGPFLGSKSQRASPNTQLKARRDSVRLPQYHAGGTLPHSDYWSKGPSWLVVQKIGKTGIGSTPYFRQNTHRPRQ